MLPSVRSSASRLLNMQNTPKGLRLQIVFFGRRNAGKSSLLNALAGQDVVIVSDVPGTTTDPVEKAMELPPVGPVLFIDTAGLDEDPTEIGAMRVRRTLRMAERCDLAIIVSDGAWTDTEESVLHDAVSRGIPVIVAFTKCDLPSSAPSASTLEHLSGSKISFVRVSSSSGEGMSALREAIIRLAPEDFLSSQAMLSGLTSPGDLILLITPIDKEAPKGRMILPQVQAIRDTLDHDAVCVVTRENRITEVLSNLKTPPALAVTDSQAFGIVSQLIPPEIPLTSFSILLARMKGDLAICAAGAAAIDSLHDGSRVLIAEACTHHPVSDDIGRSKIPNWIRRKTGADVHFDVVSGPDFPACLADCDLVIHCGACTFNRRAVLSRILRCREAGVPFTNYGVAIAHLHGILQRALQPFPSAYDAFLSAKKSG